MNRTTLLLCGCIALALGITPTNRLGEPECITDWHAVGRSASELVSLDYTKTDHDPGIAPEGDYLGWAAFTRDGSKVLLTNRMTGNVTVYDWQTMAPDTNVQIGPYIGGIAATDTYAIITVPFVDSVVIMRLADFSIAARLPSGGQPWMVKVSPDQSRAYVACDISNTLEVYDLGTLTRVLTIPDFPVSLSTVSWNSENGRNAWTFIDFELSRDCSEIAVSNRNDTLFWFDAATGACTDTMAGIGDCPVLELSGDSSKLILGSYATPSIIRQIDMATHEVTKQLSLTGYNLGCFDAGVNMDGSKVFLGFSDNKSGLVRFATSDFKVFNNTYTAFWVGTSPDHARAIGGQSYFSIIDFALDSVIAQQTGLSQSVGVVSPAAFHAVSYDPHRHEGIYFYNCTTPGPGMCRGTTNAGLDPEGDCPFGIAITPDGSKVVASGVLSDNATVFDVATGTVDTILPIADRPRNCAVTSDSRWALVASIATSDIKVIDLSNGTIAATITAASGPTDIVIASGDTLAYASDIGGNCITVIRLAGASSYKVTDVPVGELGLVWAAYGICSGVAVSPTGQYVLSAVSFDDNVKVISTATNTVVGTLTVGDFPLGIEFGSTGEYAVVTNYFANSYTVMRIDGANSSVVGTFPIGQYPARLRRNPTRDEIAICTYSGKTLVTVNPTNGNIIRTDPYSSYGPVMQVEFDETSNPVVLTGSTGSVPGHLHKGTDHIELPAAPAYFGYAPAARTAAVAMPGPDWVSLIDWSPSGVAEQRLPFGWPRLAVSPNPVRTAAIIEYSLPGTAGREFSLVDAAGRRVSVRFAAGPRPGTAVLDCGRLPAGVYLLRLASDAGVVVRPLVVSR